MIALAPFSSSVTKRAKRERVENDSHSTERRWANMDSAKTLRDVLWVNIRRTTLKKFSESKTTGLGGSGELTELEETVLDILGRESANIEPVKMEDSDIVFGEEIIVTIILSAGGKVIIIPM